MPSTQKPIGFIRGSITSEVYYFRTEADLCAGKRTLHGTATTEDEQAVLIREAHTLGILVDVYTSRIPPDATLYEWVGLPGV